jgi:DNA gyrase subunit B
VDGSHIRTLLLTFFYRQMPELIARGHVYIAQPPLFKIKRGKTERYLKDDSELNSYLLEAALEDASLIHKPGQPPITGNALKQLCQDYLVVEYTINRLSRRYDTKVLEALVHLPTIDNNLLKDRSRLEQVAASLQERLGAQANGARYDVSVNVSSLSGMNELLITRSEHGALSSTHIDSEFLGSGEYRAIRHLGSQLEGLLQKEASIHRGEKSQPVASFDEAFAWLMDEARRGQTIQRYKGLGEMNPEQLWETTMDISSRRLLKVNIEDGVAADEIFTTLMGDQVEPRREFIEKNALAVTNLDV